MDFHYLVVTRAGAERFSEHHEAALFTRGAVHRRIRGRRARRGARRGGPDRPRALPGDGSLGSFSAVGGSSSSTRSVGAAAECVSATCSSSLGLHLSPLRLLRLDRRVGGLELGAKPGDVLGVLPIGGLAERRHGLLAREPEPARGRNPADRAAGEPSRESRASRVLAPARARTPSNAAHGSARDSALARPARDLREAAQEEEPGDDAGRARPAARPATRRITASATNRSPRPRSSVAGGTPKSRRSACTLTVSPRPATAAPRPAAVLHPRRDVVAATGADRGHHPPVLPSGERSRTRSGPLARQRPEHEGEPVDADHVGLDPEHEHGHERGAEPGRAREDPPSSETFQAMKASIPSRPTSTPSSV